MESTAVRLHDFLRREFKRGYEQVHVSDAERALRMRADQFRDECYALMEAGVCKFSGAVFWNFNAKAPTPSVKALTAPPMPPGRKPARYQPRAVDDLGIVISQIGIEKVAEINGIDLGRYGHLDNGRRRMVVGNILRARQRKGEPVQL